MRYFTSVRSRSMVGSVVRGTVLVSLLVQMWPVSAVQAKGVAIAATPEASSVIAPVVKDAPSVALPTAEITPETSTTPITSPAVDPVTALPTIAPTQPPVETPVPTIAPTEPVTDTPPLDETQPVIKGQDTALANGRILVSLPLQVDLKTIRVKILTYRRLKDDEQDQQAFVFDLSATDQKDVDVHEFAEPLTVTLRVQDLVANMQPKVFYFDEINQTWWTVPVLARDEKAGTLTFVTNHFSTWCGACTGYSGDFSIKESQPKPWQLTPNLGDVNLFRGSADYGYPIDVPSMPDGLQPNVALAYSSAAADEEMRDRPSLGVGWSMAVPKITRRVRTEGADKHYANDFKLSMAGHDYNLLQKISGNYKEYVTENYAPLRIYRCNLETSFCGDGTEAQLAPVLGWGTFDSREYWKVWDASGVLYVFGADITSTQSSGTNSGANLCYEPVGSSSSCTTPINAANNTGALYAGAAASTQHGLAIGWYLRWVYSPLQGNYDILNPNAASNRWSMRYNYGSALGADFPRYEIRLGSIEYGNRFNPNTNAVISSQYQVVFDYEKDGTFGTNPINNNVLMKLVTVTVKANSVEQRRYILTYSIGAPPDLKLNKITQYAGGSGALSYPSTLFTYTQPTGLNFQLQTVDNGYGGRTTFAYSTTGTTPIAYQVITKTVTNGLTGSAGVTQITSYGYSNGCRDNNGQLCRNTNNHDFGQSGRLMGIGSVTEKSLDSGGTVIAQSNHTFHTEFKLLGMEKQTQSGYVSGGTFNILSAQQTQYAALSNASPFASTFPSAAWLTAQQVITTYTNGDIGVAPPVKTELFYNDAFGGVTTVYEHGFVSGSGDERSIQRAYTHNAGTGSNPWIIGKLAWERTYDTIMADNSASTNLRAQTLLYYDGSAVNGATPSLGQLTKIQRGQGSAPNLVSQSATYNSAGRLKTVIDANNNVITATYDNTGLFLAQMTNPKGYNDNFYYYGVTSGSCGVTSGSGLYGQLKCARDPNNNEATYTFDEFGRLRKTIQPLDSYVYPSEEYVYLDYASNGVLSNAIPLYTRHWVRKTAGAGLTKANSGTDSAWWLANGNWDLNALAMADRTYFDGLGRTVQTQTPSGDWTGATGGNIRVVNLGYDALGRLQYLTVPYGITETFAYQPHTTSITKTTTVYDSLSRVKSVIGPDGATAYMTFGYTSSPYSNRVRTIDPIGHSKVQGTDGLGRLIIVDEYNDTCANPPSSCTWTTPATTQYKYNALDSLTQVTDAQLNVTQIYYDILNRKTSMVDPDMGTWNYGYDSNGNLIGQLDANNRICMWYDALNRLKGKLYDVPGSSACGSRTDPGYTGYNSKFYYDKDELNNPVTNGIGQRVQMVNSIARASWVYDTRGRVSDDYRTVIGSVTGLHTGYGYDSANRVTSTTYPDNEVVSSAYDSASQPYSVQGTGYFFVGSATYNEMGQLKQMYHANGMSTQYRYYGLNYNGGSTASYGRLRGICVSNLAGTCSDTDASAGVRLNMAYAYTDTGNITNIGDRTRAENLVYTYDALDRLLTVSGAFAESYQYNAIGNMTSKGGVTINHTCQNLANCAGAVHPHAPISTGTATYGYDPNGNMTSRTENGVTYTQGWDNENRLSNISNNIGTSTQLSYDADSNRVQKTEIGTVLFRDEFNNLDTQSWTTNANQVIIVASGESMLRTTGTTAWAQGLAKTSYGLTSKSSVLLDVRAPSSTSVAQAFELQASTTIHYFYVQFDNGNIQVRYDNGNAQNIILGTAPFVANTWYRVKLSIDDTAGVGFTAEVRVRDTNALALSKSFAMATGLTWRFQQFVKDGVMDLDNFFERKDTAQTVVYIGNHYEKNITTGEITKYYYFGSQRVAMRNNAGVRWLHGDNLGSASIATNDTGARIAEARYTPFGSSRYQWSNLPTDKRFTGQRLEDALGLYDYGARFFDPLIGRFISADTIVPGAGTQSAQALNRYSYVMNRPLIMVDPTGYTGVVVHCLICGDWFSVAAWAEPAQYLAVAGCAVIGCHVDPDTKMVRGPTVEEAVTASVVGMVNEPIGHGSEQLSPHSLTAKSATALNRFKKIGDNIVPDILEAVGDRGTSSSKIPSKFASRNTITLGSRQDTLAAGELGERILNIPNWTLDKNFAWMQEGVAKGDIFYLATPVTDANLRHPDFKVTVYARELDYLLQSGYQRIGDYMVPK